MPLRFSTIRSSTTLRSFQSSHSFTAPLLGRTFESTSPAQARYFHIAAPVLARRSRERNRPKPPVHPSVPSFKTSPQDSSRTVTARRKLLGFKSRANSDEFAWKLDPAANVMRRRDGITGKYEHSKIDWVAEKKRKFFKLKQQEHTQREDDRFVSRRSEDPSITDPTDKTEKPLPPPREWSLPAREWNRGAPSLIHEYGREDNPIYSYEQRQSLALLRKSAQAHEKRRQELLSQGASLSDSQAQDASFWDYEKNFRNPLYDFFRGGVTLEDSSVSDSIYHSWSVTQLRRKSFQDLQVLWFILLKERNLLLTQRLEAKRSFSKLIDPASPGEPLSTIRAQLKSVQFSLRNIKVTVSERRRAIESRIKFLTKYQAKRGRETSAQQWQIALQLEKQRIQTTDGHPLQHHDLDAHFASSDGRQLLEQILRKKGLAPKELRNNMEAYDLSQSAESYMGDKVLLNIQHQQGVIEQRSD